MCGPASNFVGCKSCNLHSNEPYYEPDVLRLFFDGDNDTRPDYRLSRESLNALLSMLHEDRHHGWGQTIKVLVFIFWLACGTSYRVVSDAFSIPKTTVFRSVREVLYLGPSGTTEPI